jgi:hypothetical protein
MGIVSIYKQSNEPVTCHSKNSTTYNLAKGLALAFVNSESLEPIGYMFSEFDVKMDSSKSIRFC